MRSRLLIVAFLHLTFILSAQRNLQFLQLEKVGSMKVEKISLGTVITYSIKDGQGWYSSEIANFLYKDQLIAMADRTIPLNEITALRYDRTWPRAIGRQIGLFGLSWSGYAFVGTLTDGRPETSYRTSDAIVTGSALAVGLLLPKLISFRVKKIGKKYRLRLLDLRPE
jgi:hypothetical protein